jgi:hypothetical protein
MEYECEVGFVPRLSASVVLFFFAVVVVVV